MISLLGNGGSNHKVQNEVSTLVFNLHIYCFMPSNSSFINLEYPSIYGDIKVCVYI